ncbi:zinc ribbon domain-containing protein [Piscibacillus sp. B03]|uniref:zinc ribbon domain-containing protein n=1 Tax=Piscibacillus sp. B03 TaxID=3457430 RepID=UPI003FCDA2BF
MIYCTKCGSPNPDEANYCQKDGYSLHNPTNLLKLTTKLTNYMQCHHCGTEQLNEAQYCYVCGESFEKLSSNHEYDKPLPIQSKKIKVRSFKRPLILAVPFVILCILFLYVFSSATINLLEKSQYTNQNIYDVEENQQHFQSYRYLIDNLNHIKAEATGMWNQQGGPSRMHSALSPIDLMMIGHLGKVNVSISEEFEAREEQSLLHEFTMRPGLAFYFLMASFSLFLVSMLYAFRAKVSDEKDWIVHTISFSTVYSLSIWLISLFSRQSNIMDHGSVSQITSYAYGSMGLLIKSFIMSFIIMLIVLSFKKGFTNQSSFAKSIKKASLALMTILLTIIILSTLIVTGIQDMSPYQLILGAALVTGVVLIVQLAIYLVNLSLFNTFEFKSMMFNDEQFKYSLLQRSEPHLYTDLLVQGFENLQSYAWVILGIMILVLYMFSRSFRKLSSREKWVSILQYSLIISVTLAGLTYAASLSFDVLYQETDEQYFIGFSSIFVFLSSLIISLIISTIGAIKVRE